MLHLHADLTPSSRTISRAFLLLRATSTIMALCILKLLCSSPFGWRRAVKRPGMGAPGYRGEPLVPAGLEDAKRAWGLTARPAL
jgi:hypothetical protein